MELLLEVFDQSFLLSAQLFDFIVFSLTDASCPKLLDKLLLTSSETLLDLIVLLLSFFEFLRLNLLLLGLRDPDSPHVDHKLLC